MSAIRPLTNTLYDELAALPETFVGEIIDGELYKQPRPTGPHALSASALGGELYGLFPKGRGGPGGWWIIDEPEIHFVRDTEVLVPDIAGWRASGCPRPAGSALRRDPGLGWRSAVAEHAEEGPRR